ncbi:tetraacyldisaccharide 4'-kinase [Mucilaginibacter robiniae]|uniref:Tetraacyldisaccharide 4'-kinase n=1 Tax=Mucilaginibacter robiniae TaxID=2728022 RepID=A0A7L5DVI2_9SPHI|nr:tetraacyldisaccharide 4'-kinase [Mucilaginibacter robiniae]QJD95082.1 tetraacyldisaccharide 4'-kinase [Mucilaginibacter robiniae]
MKYLRWLLFPFSLLYGLVVLIRNWCYDAGIYKSRQFDLPVISVGNLDVGGAGKSPMTEYSIRLLKNELHLATLSRGYGRKTKGYLVATPFTTAAQVGDEPAQFKQKFPEITVAVCEKRVIGIENLQASGFEAVILDDAYQHRAVKPGFSILLFDYNRLQEPHLLLPAGNLREPFSGRRRADVLVVSKCPAQLTETQQKAAIKRISPYPNQQVYFTTISYLPLANINGQPVLTVLDENTYIFLLTGIANPKPMLQYLQGFSSHITHHNYPDHHPFSLKNIAKLADGFNRCTASRKVIITTEKDAQRLREPDLAAAMSQLPVLVLPIGIQFLNNGEEPFKQTIVNYVRKYTTHHGLH